MFPKAALRCAPLLDKMADETADCVRFMNAKPTFYADWPAVATNQQTRAPVQISNLAEGVIIAANQAGEGTARSRGQLELFQKTRAIPGFDQAEASWRAAWEKMFHRTGFRRLGSLRESTPTAIIELFYVQLRGDAAAALKKNHMLILNKACAGDVHFFQRIGSELRNAKRRRVKESLPGYVLANWLHGFLWLMAANWGSYHLEKLVPKGIKCSQENYEKCVQRLGLIGWEAEHTKPIITGFNKHTGEFVFQKGWTSLATKLSG